MFYFFMLIVAQIILESFPISSSGHLVLLEHFFSFHPFLLITSNKMFEHFLHGPTVIVLAAFFYDRWIFLLKNIRICWSYIIKIIGLAFAADIVTSMFFVLFHYVDTSFFSVGVGFLISAFALLSLKFCNKKVYGFVTIKKALILGAIQGIALLPGISRFGTTFVVGCWLGLSPKKSFEFSFIIFWPLVFFGFLKSLITFFKIDFTVAGIYLLDSSVLICIAISSIISFFVMHFVQFWAFSKKLWLFSFVLLFSFVMWFFLLKLS